MPATVRIVYDGPFVDGVDMPSAGLFGVRPGEPVEVGATVAAIALTHPDWREAPASAKTAVKEA